MNIYLDIETIPDQRDGALDRAINLVKIPANYKKPEVIEKYRLEHADEVHDKTALKGIAGEVCSIAWAIDNNDVQAITRDPDMTETGLLDGFFKAIQAETPSGQGTYPSITWIGHNVIEFDLRFLKQRALINNIRPPFLIPADARHGKSVFDTMKEWAGWKGYVKLDDLCEAFGLDGKGNVDGSMVSGMWKRGEYQAIHEYNKQDVEMTRSVYQRMIWED